MKTKLTILALATLAGMALAAPQTFNFKDPKGINNAGFKLDAPLESINGSASGVSGTVTFDPENPGATSGKITVATSSLMVPNPMQRQHMLSDKWLDAAKFPEISFESKEFKNVQTVGDASTRENHFPTNPRYASSLPLNLSSTITFLAKIIYSETCAAARLWERSSRESVVA